METTISGDTLALASFIEALRFELPDPRDNRGKRHSLEFTLTAVAIALLCHCQSLSSIHRFIHFRLDWLRQITGMLTAPALSRAHLPRLLDRIDWGALNQLIQRFFSAPLALGGWTAVDGKTLRGSSKGDTRQAVVLAVAHATGDELYRMPQAGAKTSEIPVVRQLLRDSGLEHQKVTLDAQHCNPDTMGQMAKAKGVYLVQVKENQSVLLQKCCATSIQEPPLARATDVDKANGRVTVRSTQLFALRQATLDKRWRPGKIRYLVTVLRETYTMKDKSTTLESSYYITNSVSAGPLQDHLQELGTAIRRH